MPLTITDEMCSMIATAVVGGGDCHREGDAVTLMGVSSIRDHVGCLCCASDARSACALIVGDEYADALYEWVYGELGCGFHHADIRRGELGMELVGGEREQEFLDRISEIDEILTTAERDAAFA